MIVIKTKYDINNTPNDFNKMFQILLYNKREEIIAAYKEVCGPYYADILGDDPIEEWFGFGSIVTYELPCITTIGFSCDEIILTIFKENN